MRVERSSLHSYCMLGLTEEGILTPPLVCVVAKLLEGTIRDFTGFDIATRGK